MKQGEMELQLGPDKITLRATPHALRTVLSKHEDLRTALQRVYMMNDSIMYDIIEAAVSDGKKAINREALQTNVFEYGIINLVEPLTEYLMLLANGGKPVEGESDEKKA